MSFHTLCWTDIPVWDLERAIGFYSKVLGRPVVKQNAGPEVEFGVLPGADVGPSGCLTLTEDNRPSEFGPLIYLSVEGRLDEAILAVRQAHGQVIQEPHQIGPHGYRAVILDTEGNRLALHSKTR